MNQGRIWCVVNPTVGLPLFLGSVTTIALLVHASVLTNTTWFSNYWQGRAADRAALKNSTAPVASVVPGDSPGFAITMAPVAGSPGKGETSFVITVTPTGAGTQHAATAVDDPALPSESRMAAGPPADQ